MKSFFSIILHVCCFVYYGTAMEVTKQAKEERMVCGLNEIPCNLPKCIDVTCNRQTQTASQNGRCRCEYGWARNPATNECVLLKDELCTQMALQAVTHPIPLPVPAQIFQSRSIGQPLTNLNTGSAGQNNFQIPPPDFSQGTTAAGSRPTPQQVFQPSRAGISTQLGQQLSVAPLNTAPLQQQQPSVLQPSAPNNPAGAVAQPQGFQSRQIGIPPRVGQQVFVQQAGRPLQQNVAQGATRPNGINLLPQGFQPRQMGSPTRVGQQNLAGLPNRCLGTRCPTNLQQTTGRQSNGFVSGLPSKCARCPSNPQQQLPGRLINNFIASRNLQGQIPNQLPTVGAQTRPFLQGQTLGAQIPQPSAATQWNPNVAPNPQPGSFGGVQNPNTVINWQTQPTGVVPTFPKDIQNSNSVIRPPPQAVFIGAQNPNLGIPVQRPNLPANWFGQGNQVQVPNQVQNSQTVPTAPRFFVTRGHTGVKNQQVNGGQAQAVFPTRQNPSFSANRPLIHSGQSVPSFNQFPFIRSGTISSEAGKSANRQPSNQLANIFQPRIPSAPQLPAWQPRPQLKLSHSVPVYPQNLIGTYFNSQPLKSQS